MHCIRKSQRSKKEIEGISGQTFIFEEDQKINCCKNQYSILKIYDSVQEHQPGVSYLLRFRSGASTRSLVSSTIPFGSINPESRIFYDSVREHQPGVSHLLRFRSGASTWSLVSSCDSVREHQPGVSHLLRFRLGTSIRSLVSSTILFGSVYRSLVFFLWFHSGNVTIFRIKVSKKKIKKKENSKIEKEKSKKIEKGKIQKKIEKNQKKKGNLFLVVLDKICVFCLYPFPDSQQCVKRGSCRRLILSGLLCLCLFLFHIIRRIFK